MRRSDRLGRSVITAPGIAAAHPAAASRASAAPGPDRPRDRRTKEIAAIATAREQSQRGRTRPEGPRIAGRHRTREVDRALDKKNANERRASRRVHAPCAVPSAEARPRPSRRDDRPRSSSRRYANSVPLSRDRDGQHDMWSQERLNTSPADPAASISEQVANLAEAERGRRQGEARARSVPDAAGERTLGRTRCAVGAASAAAERPSARARGRGTACGQAGTGNQRSGRPQTDLP